MSQKQKTETKKKTVKRSGKVRGKWHWTTYVFIIFGVIVLIPVLIFGAISLNAYFKTGTPIFGTRYYGDLNPAISTEQIAQVKASLEEMENVEKVEINLKSATLRISVKTVQDISADQYAAIYTGSYDKTIAVLPVAEYFTANTELSKNQYDLEINVYNIDPTEIIKDTEGTLDDQYIYFILEKSSLMEDYTVQEVSVPIDAEQAEELRQKVIDRDTPTETEEPVEEGTEEQEGE